MVTFTGFVVDSGEKTILRKQTVTRGFIDNNQLDAVKRVTPIVNANNIIESSVTVSRPKRVFRAIMTRTFLWDDDVDQNTHLRPLIKITGTTDIPTSEKPNPRRYPLDGSWRNKR